MLALNPLNALLALFALHPSGGFPSISAAQEPVAVRSNRRGNSIRAGCTGCAGCAFFALCTGVSLFTFRTSVTFHALWPSQTAGGVVRAGRQIDGHNVVVKRHIRHADAGVALRALQRAVVLPALAHAVVDVDVVGFRRSDAVGHTCLRVRHRSAQCRSGRVVAEYLESGTGVTLRPLRASWSGLPLWAGFSLRSLQSLRPLRTDRTLLALNALNALRTLRTGCALRTFGNNARIGVADHPVLRGFVDVRRDAVFTVRAWCTGCTLNRRNRIHIPFFISYSENRNSHRSYLLIVTPQNQSKTYRFHSCLCIERSYSFLSD